MTGLEGSATPAAFTLHLPRRVHVGTGSLARLRDALGELSARSVFLVTDAALVRLGLVDELLRALAPGALRVKVFDEIESEPRIACIEGAAAALAAAAPVDALISLGGGSVIDVAKCANVVAGNGGAVTDYEAGAADPRQIATLLPHIAVPTTAGTGSEATAWAVFIDPERGVKNAIFDPRLVAELAILEPGLTVTLPPLVTAGTGMDALTHAIEAYVSVLANPFTKALAATAIKLIARNLTAAVADGHDLAARTDMLQASFLAGAAFSNSSCGLVHTLSEAIGGVYRTPHGITNAVLLPTVMAFNLEAEPAAYAAIATFLAAAAAGSSEREAAESSVVAVRDLATAIGLPCSLAELGVGADAIPALAEAAALWADESGNPRQADQQQLAELYMKVY
jgi:alcohol dehydrogenase class IV